MPYEVLDVRPMTKRIGAEIFGVDLNEPLGNQTVSELHDALGTHSGRKSLAQWLWDDGHCRRIIADAGGWFLKRDAVDMYFKTARHIILNAVKSIGRSLGVTSD